jgi:MraZ protein
MFRGSALAKIDEKGRLKVPSDFRSLLEERHGPEVFITSVRGDVALLYPLGVWEEVEGRLLALPATDRSRQRFMARVSYYGQQGRLDSQGRILIPQVLREDATMTGDVVVCGSLDHLEIWNRESFVAGLAKEPFTEDDFRSLSERGI